MVFMGFNRHVEIMVKRGHSLVRTSRHYSRLATFNLKLAIKKGNDAT